MVISIPLYASLMQRLMLVPTMLNFQTFKADRLAAVDAGLADYQRQAMGDESQKAMLSKLELRDDWHSLLIDHAEARSIKFLSTAFDIESLSFLSKLGVDVIKIPSGEITNGPLLQHAGGLKKPIILSTGMATLGEIEDALSTLLRAGALREDIILLHCTTEYPAPFDEINLNAMGTLRNAFGLKVGYSDHSQGINVSIAAAALGAVLIEKHFTIDRSMPGPDHKASLEPGELKELISGVREIELAMGSHIKAPTPAERENIIVARKSLVASVNITKGELFTAENLCVKRPGNGVSPMLMEFVIGRKAPRDFKSDELIEI